MRPRPWKMRRDAAGIQNVDGSYRGFGNPSKQGFIIVTACNYNLVRWDIQDAGDICLLLR